MCSSARPPSGSRKRCGGEPGRADRCAEGRARCCGGGGGVVSGAGRVAGMVFQVAQGRRSRKRRAALSATIAYLFAKHKGTYGSPRITADLRAQGWRVSQNTVATLMAEQGLVARRKHKRRGTTQPDKSARKAPDGLRRDFSPPQRPDARWCGDLTEIPTDEGKLQLAAVLDLHSRRCVGFAMGRHHDAALARAALCVAIAVRGGVVAGCCSTPIMPRFALSRGCAEMACACGGCWWISRLNVSAAIADCRAFGVGLR